MPSCGFVLAGKAYDAAWIREMIEAQDGGVPCRSACGPGRRCGPDPCTFHDAFPQWVWVVIDGPSQGSDSSIDARPSASPERAARRGGRWADAACEGFLPSCAFRPSRTGRAEGPGATERPLRLEHLGGTSASVPGHDGRPVGSLRLERQYRDRKASWRPVVTTDRKECHGRT